jgi:uncharacterized protein
MQKKVIIDSGPLVALFNKDDSYHNQSIDFIKNFRGQLFTNLAVITEVFYLLDYSVRDQLNFIKWIAKGAVTIIDLIQSDYERLIELIEKYSDLPIDLADASLMTISERLKIYDVATIDSEFYIYRMKNKKFFTNVFLK